MNMQVGALAIDLGVKTHEFLGRDAMLLGNLIASVTALDCNKNRCQYL